MFHIAVLILEMHFVDTAVLKEGKMAAVPWMHVQACRMHTEQLQNHTDDKPKVTTQPRTQTIIYVNAGK